MAIYGGNTEIAVIALRENSILDGVDVVKRAFITILSI